MFKPGQVGGDKRRLRWLDALRGVAAMVVVLGHYFWQSSTPLMKTVFDPGTFGVAVFFLISGFIVPLSVRPDRDRAAFRFAWSRVFRLYPLYWLSVAFGATVMGTTLVQELFNLSMVQRFLGVNDILGVYWTLQIEFLFYVIIGLTIVTKQFNRVWMVASLAILFAVTAALLGFIRFHYHLKAPMAVPTGLSIIFVGNLRSLVEERRLTTRAFIAVGMIVAGFIIAAVYMGFNQPWVYEEQPGRFVVSYFLAALVFFGCFHLSHRKFTVTAFLGVISYPIYLFHQPMLELFGDWFPALDPVALRVLTIPVVLLLSWILHICVETQAVKLGRALLPSKPHRAEATLPVEIAPVSPR